MLLWRGQHNHRPAGSFLAVCLALCAVTSWGRSGPWASPESDWSLSSAGQPHPAVEPSLATLASVPSHLQLQGLRHTRLNLHPTVPAGVAAPFSTISFPRATLVARLALPQVLTHPLGIRGPP